MPNILNLPHRNKLVVATVCVLLVIGILAGTKFKGVGESSGPKAFNPTTYAQQKWTKLVEQINVKATDVATLAAAVDADLAAAGKKYGQNLGADSYAFPVKATGVVAAVDANFITLTVAKMPARDVVRIPMGPALNGAAIRDATGLIQFGDFTDQTDYQTVADALRVLSQKDVVGKISPPLLKGKTITVVGAFASGGPPNAYSISPVKIEVAS